MEIPYKNNTRHYRGHYRSRTGHASSWCRSGGKWKDAPEGNPAQTLHFGRPEFILTQGRLPNQPNASTGLDRDAVWKEFEPHNQVILCKEVDSEMVASAWSLHSLLVSLHFQHQDLWSRECRGRQQISTMALHFKNGTDQECQQNRIGCISCTPMDYTTNGTQKGWIWPKIWTLRKRLWLFRSDRKFLSGMQQSE